MAEAAYQQDLPPFYVTSCHLSKVSVVNNIISMLVSTDQRRLDDLLEEVKEDDGAVMILCWRRGTIS